MPMTPAERARLTQAGLNLIQQALTIYDADLRLAVCNARFARMFDLPDHLVTPGARFEDTIRYLAERGEYGPVRDPESFVALRVTQALSFVPHYLERTRSNGQVISIEGNPLPQGGWVTVYTDITSVHEQEQLLRGRSEELSDRVLEYTERLSQTNRKLAASITALEEAKRELTEMEARTRLTAEMMPAHIARLDMEECYTYSNRRLSSVLPQSPSEILGLPIREALGCEAYEAIGPYLARAYAGEANVFEFTHEPSSRRIRAAFTPDREGAEAGGGEVIGVYILSMDVTREMQARAALAQTRRRELAAQLTSGMAHDFANLLTIILGMQSRLEGMDLPPEARELVAATRAAVRRGGKLLDRIGRISGPREIRPVAVDLGAFLADLRTMATPSLPPDVRFDIIHDGPRADLLLLDPDALNDALLNLVLNARDAAGPSGRITLSVRPVANTWIDFELCDTGPGFSPEALKQAMAPFYTTKGGEGSGLGLAMVYDIAKMCGGSLRIANGPAERTREGAAPDDTDGPGARVILRLPLRAASLAPPVGMALLVEDNPDIRDAVRPMLTDAGYSVIEAASADEALGLAELPGLSLVLSDISLEGARTGLDLAQELAAQAEGPPVLLMTALPAGDQTRQRAEAAFRLIPKPFTAAELLAFLADAPAPMTGDR